MKLKTSRLEPGSRKLPGVKRSYGGSVERQAGAPSFGNCKAEKLFAGGRMVTKVEGVGKTGISRVGFRWVQFRTAGDTDGFALGKPKDV